MDNITDHIVRVVQLGERGQQQDQVETTHTWLDHVYRALKCDNMIPWIVSGRSVGGGPSNICS